MQAMGLVHAHLGDHDFVFFKKYMEVFKMVWETQARWIFIAREINSSSIIHGNIYYT